MGRKDDFVPVLRLDLKRLSVDGGGAGLRRLRVEGEGDVRPFIEFAIAKMRRRLQRRISWQVFYFKGNRLADWINAQTAPMGFDEPFAGLQRVGQCESARLRCHFRKCFVFRKIRILAEQNPEAWLDFAACRFRRRDEFKRRRIGFRMDGHHGIETDLVDFQILEESGALPFDANPYLDVLYVVGHGARHADGDALPICFAEWPAWEFAAIDPFLVFREHAEEKRRATVFVVAEADIDGFDHDAAAIRHTFFNGQVKRDVSTLPIVGGDLDGAIRFRNAFIRNVPASVAQSGDAFGQRSLEDRIVLHGGYERKRE